VLGGTGEGSTGNDIPIVLRDALGLNIRLVAGYPDSNGLYLAIERGEIEGRITDFSSVKANRPHWIKQGDGPGEMNILLQFARRTRHPDLPNVPTARELATTEKAKALIELAELPFYMSRPFAAPPGIPAERAKALQKAFIDVHKDPELLAEAAKLSLGVTPVAGTEFYPLIEQLAKSPPELLDYIRKLQDANKG
jgi:tripartite-type tricarboxylate transporter receptor subunit TctC